MVIAIAGCSGSQSKSSSAGSSDTTAPVGHSMAGAASTIVVTRAAIDSKPQPPVLTTPESAVKSYLDWTSYAYRIATSDVASATMTPDEGVRVDSYIQLNVEKSQLIDQALTSITFGKPSVEATRATVTTKEKWSYRYVSIQTAGKTVGGPYTASYDATYTLAKTPKGWVVDSVKAKALGEVK